MPQRELLRHAVSARLGMLLLVAFVSGCTYLPDKPSGTPSRAFTDTADTTLGRFAVSATSAARSSDESAICVLDRGEEALVSRFALIDLAERSVDIQTFCWTSDQTGKLLAEHLLGAAERGVRVRVLLDDLDVGGRDFNIAMFDSYDNVEIRLYNPFRARFFWRLGRPLELLSNMDRLDHRMHNKTFVVDGQAAVVGGRNIGDEYFGVSPKYNYRDFDLLMFGHAAVQASESFDVYWADGRAYPVHDVAPHEFKPDQQREARSKLDATTDAMRATFPYHMPASKDEALAFISKEAASSIIAPTQMLFDDPSKGSTDVEQPSRIRQVLARIPPTQRLLLINPYFIPQEKLITLLADQARSGVAVCVLTNSLASTDVVAVHAAYTKRRKTLLASGVELHELRADAQDRDRLIASSCSRSTLALHGKVLVVDSRRVFVGSMNLDPRSHHLNTEGGMLIDSPELAKQVEDAFAVDLQPQNSWKLALSDGKMRWSTLRDQAEHTEEEDPDASWWLRFKCGLLEMLPVEHEL